MANIIDAITHQCAAVDAHASGETGMDIRVIATVLQHYRVNHAASQDLQPASVLANLAAITAT